MLLGLSVIHQLVSLSACQSSTHSSHIARCSFFLSALQGLRCRVWLFWHLFCSITREGSSVGTRVFGRGWACWTAPWAASLKEQSMYPAVAVRCRVIRCTYGHMALFSTSWWTNWKLCATVGHFLQPRLKRLRVSFSSCHTVHHYFGSDHIIYFFCGQSSKLAFSQCPEV